MKRMPVPSMKSINAQKKKFKAMSFFAGCGGSSTGLKWGGFDVIFSNEFVPAARETYKENHPGTVVSGADIRRLNFKKIMQHFNLKPGDLDHLDGSPPCKSFSTAGTIDEGWGKESHYSDGIFQRTDDLFFEFTRALRAFQPKTFTAENVSGMVKGVSKGYFLEILSDLKACGYKVRAQVLNASYLDVPQARERLIFVGVREDLPFEPVFPAPRPYQVTVRQALPHVDYVKTKKKGDIAYVPAGIPSPTITASDGTTSETAGFSCGGFIEDNEGVRRKYTIKELRVICGFPKDFKLTGKFEQQWERLGRSVPPPMMYHLAHNLIEEVHTPLKNQVKAGKLKIKKVKSRKMPDGTSPYEPRPQEDNDES